jgi:hypothetical protein
MSTFLLNGSPLASLGLANPRLSYASMQADALTLDHLTAAWDADPIFAYAETLTLTRDGVPVFVGRVRRFPRFAGPTAETTSYEILGPWDWLERRAFVQQVAVVADPAVSTTPIYVASGFVILNQLNDGTSVNIADSLAVVINQAISSGVPILLGTITGFDYATGWDEITDLTLADAITRLLASAPDAVVWWDYTTAPTPTIHIGRRANLADVSLVIAPAGSPPSAYGPGGYAEFESLRLMSRPDLVVPGTFITYRSTDTVNGASYLKLVGQNAVSDLSVQHTAENALVRTVELAGASFSETILTQECKTLPLAAALTGGGTVTSGGDFDELMKFWKRKVPALAHPDVVIKGFKDRGREAAPVASAAGENETPILDTSLVRELIEGAITPWMREGGLNRKGQEQNFTARIAFSIKGVDQKDADGMGIVFTAGVMATTISVHRFSILLSENAV